jgi:hypothetical protein
VGAEARRTNLDLVDIAGLRSRYSFRYNGGGGGKDSRSQEGLKVEGCRAGRSRGLREHARYAASGGRSAVRSPVTLSTVSDCPSR